MAMAKVAQTTEQDAVQERRTECPRNTILQGHALDVLRSLPDACVQLVITSPPYYSLRDYKTDPQIWGGDPPCGHVWGQAYRTPWANEVPGPHGRRKNCEASQRRAKETGPFCVHCGAWRGEFGQEMVLDCMRSWTPDRCGICYVCHLLDVMRGVWRVLRPDGQVYLNLGDGFAGSWGNYAPRGMKFAQRERHKGGERWARRAYGDESTQWRPPATQLSSGLKNKDLMMVPHRCAIALQQDGWWVRQDNVWDKPNGLPSSQNDRTTRSHEYVFQLTKRETYFYDATAIAEPVAKGSAGSTFISGKTGVIGLGRTSQKAREERDTRTKRSVWRIPPAQFKAAHFAVMPEEIAEIAILCGTSPRACEVCGAPWHRITRRTRMQVRSGPISGRYGSRTTDGVSGTMVAPASVETVGWAPACRCPEARGLGRCLVLDPFVGAGTVPVVAQRLERDWLGVELQAKYIPLALRRIRSAGCAHVVLTTYGDDDESEPLPEQAALFG